MASKPSSATRRAESASATPGATRQPGREMRALKCPAACFTTKYPSQASKLSSSLLHLDVMILFKTRPHVKVVPYQRRKFVRRARIYLGTRRFVLALQFGDLHDFHERGVQFLDDIWRRSSR